MPVSVTMPRLGESVTEGTVTRWLKKEGDRVEVDEPLLEVSTDKVDTEIPSPAAGILSRIVVSEDETAEVGSELAVIAGEGESAEAGPAAEAPAQEAPAQEAPAQEAPAEQPTPEQGGEEPAGQAAPAEPQQQAPQQPAPTREEPAEQPSPEEVRAEAAQRTREAAEPASGEATVVRMPALGESVTEGTVTRWLKQVGDTVETDEPLLEVSTDKVDTEIPSPTEGTLLEIKVPQDGTASVGEELAVIGAAGGPPTPQPTPEAPAPEGRAEAPPQAPAPERPRAEAPPQAPAAERPRAEAPPQPPQPPPSPAPRAEPQPPAAPAQPARSEEGAGYVTPLVRKLASEQGVDLTSVNGTGIGGRIRKQDVLDAAEKARAQAPPAAAPAAAAPEPQAAPMRGRTEKMSRTRAVIARRMFESLQSSAQLTTVVEVDVTKVARLREQAKADFQAKHGVKLSFLPFFALAAVEALQRYPIVNASIDMEAGTITYPDGVHLGIAVDTDKGLLVPVIRNADELNLAGLARRIADVAGRTRTNKIGPDELSGGTFTVTNTGSRGALFDTPIVPSPQSAILGTGAVVKRAVVIDNPDLGEAIVPRFMVYLAMSYDHRLVDGADAARFLAAVKERLEAGAFESELGLA